MIHELVSIPPSKQRDAPRSCTKQKASIGLPIEKGKSKGRVNCFRWGRFPLRDKGSVRKKNYRLIY